MKWWRLSICGDTLDEVMKMKYYTMIADEVADISNKEQLLLALWYVLDGGVKEVFVEVERITGESLAQAILQWLATHGLPFTTTREVSATIVLPTFRC